MRHAERATGTGQPIVRSPHEREPLTLMRRVVLSAPRASAEPSSMLEMVGRSDAMRVMQQRLARVAATDVAVLLTGESGTGKALAARALHTLSRREAGPYVSVNCSAMPPEVLEAELFGHVDGGRFASAHGGTLLLDEIGDLSPVAQSRLWWLLEHGEIVRPGLAPLAVDVRVIATSHRALDHLVSEGKFRDDLLYRLRVMTVHLPPLRERAGDLTLLIDHFVRVFCERHGLPLRSFDYTATALLQRHRWPGNVRELRNVIESAVLLAEGPTMTVRELPSALSTKPDTMLVTTMVDADTTSLTFVEARERALREFDRAFLRAALERHGGNVARTARALGLHRQSLQKLLVRRELRVAHEGLHAS